MSEENCCACRRPKATIQCELCEDWNCKSCGQILGADTFAFLKQTPEELQHSRYCQTCWQEHVEPALEDYRDKLESARGVFIFFTTQRKPVPILSKEKEQVLVQDCNDRDEVILRLAFQAVELGCNAVIQTLVSSEKVRNAGWQKTLWRGSGIPAQVDAEKLERY